MSSGMLAKILVLACASALAGTIATGVSGTVHVTPAHPGPQRVGESGRKPMAGITVQVRDKDSRVAARVVTDADGRFSASVPAGEYWLEVDVGAAALPRCGAAQAVVQDGQVADVELECDSGMR
jgi:FlaG/FlaF family flagellin (archaellin)